ncbi:hypothetical protein F4553_005550 [Allocatelliglobosispora scoriae]|uniref:LamG-like jellyroll fold domain-containing protein n=1 Tax=Allocatelliglobosispora scoriae TaxID=643052 RepID=A0A841BX75_9ACTN|nr:carboxypeptidase regulatory-like domain-containing protein [Allocatelliglobosispora scoriae]MBB5872116.1 hypothetical protein [Allocatelliglobosispora scoriae]
MSLALTAAGGTWLPQVAAAAPAASPFAVATANAKVGNKPIEVLSERTEWAQTFANPNGTFTLIENASPQRVRRADGSWASIDTNLHREADGTLSPGAALGGMRFSGGGSRTPMASMTVNGRVMRLWWPGTLPAPVVEGSTATYPNVLKDVDLKVTAEASQFIHVFVIKNRAAAADPAVRKIKLRTTFDGLRLRNGRAGALEAVDPSGTVFFTGASPLMWDSSGDAAGAENAVEARQAPVATSFDASSLTLAPNTKLLTDPKAVFPLHIDPPWAPATGSRLHHTVVRKTFPDQSNYDRFTGLGSNDDTTGVLRSGYNNSSGSYTDRSMLQMDLSAVKNARIGYAKVTLTHAWSGAGCASSGKGYWTDMHSLPYGFDGSTTWNTLWNKNDWGWGPILASTDVVHRYGESCGTDRVGFDVTGEVANRAAAADPNLWVGLRGRCETCANMYWRRFKPDFQVEIQYNRPPNAPDVRKIDGKPCTTGAGRPWVTAVSPMPDAMFYQSDPDSPSYQNTLWTELNWWELGTSTVHTIAGVERTANSEQTIRLDGPLVDGKSYAWQARTSDSIETGQLSAVCEFSYDASPPNNAVAPTALVYNGTTLTGGPGIADTFTFNPPTTKPEEVVGYAYAFGNVGGANGVQVDSVDAARKASVSIAPPADGTVTLYVWAKDRAARYSASPATFTFLVKPGGQAAKWDFEGADPKLDKSPFALNPLAAATTTAGRSDRTELPNKALSLTGSNYAETTGSPVQTKANNAVVNVATNASFTVAAWVKINTAGATDQVAMAVNAGNTAGITLGYGGSEGKWVARMAEQNVVSPTVKSSVSSAAPVTGRWTHLAATYEGTSKVLTLYVNGVAQTAAAPLATVFNATGKLSIGAQWTGSAYGRNLTGAVDDVAFYNTIITPSTIGDLARPLPPKATQLTANPVTVGTSVQVKFDSYSDTNVTKFPYNVNVPIFNPPTTPEATATAAAATVTVAGTSLNPGSNTVYVKAKDAAGRLSDLSVLDITVVSLPSLVGYVFDEQGNAIGGATVTLNPGNRTTTSAGDGSFEFTSFPAGTYTLSAIYGTHCGLSGSTSITVTDDTGADLVLSPTVSDVYGYACAAAGAGSFVAGTASVALTGDNAVAQVSTPFTFNHYGKSVSTVWIDSNGVAYTVNPGVSNPVPVAIPNRSAPSGLIAPYWADLVLDGSSGVYTATTGSAPNRTFVIEWRNAALKSDTTKRLSFEALIGENGSVTYRYSGIDNATEAGIEAIVGMESEFGSAGTSYSSKESVLANTTEVVFAYPETPVPLPVYTISGTVTAAGVNAVGVTVTLDPLGLTAVTNASGYYHFDGLPEGNYHVTAQLCLSSGAASITLTGNTTQNFALAQVADSFGYTCTVRSQPFIPADQQVVQLAGDDFTTQIAFPFVVPLYGDFRSGATISTNGYLALDGSTDAFPGNHEAPIPSTSGPNGVIAPFWDDLIVDGSASVRTAVIGTAPNRQFIIEWRNVTHFDDQSVRFSFEVILGEDGEVSFAYAGGLDTDIEKGSSATVGLENLQGTSGRIVSYNQPILQEGEAVAFAYPGGVPTPTSTLSGSVRVNGAIVAGGVDLVLGPDRATTISDASGNYQFTNLFPGTYTVTAYYCGKSATGTLTIGASGTLPQLNVAAQASGAYTCSQATTAFIPGDTAFSLSGDDVFTQVSTPFPVSLYGQTTSSITVNSDGAIFMSPTSGINIDNHAVIPNVAVPNGFIAPFWDDFYLDGSSGMYTKTIGSAPNRKFVVEWRNATFYNVPGNPRVSVEVIFSENGQITFNYAGLDTLREGGSLAVLGLENSTGTAGFNLGYHVPALVSGRAITFTP